MKTVLCLDIGSSALKVIALRDGKAVSCGARFAKPASTSDLETCVQKYIASNALQNLSAVAITGVGASLAGDTLARLPVTQVSEFEAIAAGGLYLSNKNAALVVSMGTGTAFLYADRTSGEVHHLGGTGVGGGTLCGLCRHLVGTSDFREIESLALQGSYTAVDLTIGDVSPAAIGTLHTELTAANFAKLTTTPSPADLAAGAINMVLQSIGSMAVFLASSCSTHEIVLTGALASIQQAKPAYDFFNRMYDVSFTIAENPTFACAIGAGLCVK